MEYSKEHQIRDFADRTKANLALVRNCAGHGDRSYEFTQLINSMLGLLVFPQQKYFKQIPKTPLSDLQAQGWPHPLVTGSFQAPKDLHDLMRLLRNSIAHFNMQFITDQGTLAGVRLWNTDPSTNKKTWQVEFTTEQLEDLTDRFLDMLARQVP